CSHIADDVIVFEDLQSPEPHADAIACTQAIRSVCDLLDGGQIATGSRTGAQRQQQRSKKNAPHATPSRFRLVIFSFQLKCGGCGSSSTEAWLSPAPRPHAFTSSCRTIAPVPGVHAPRDQWHKDCSPHQRRSPGKPIPSYGKHDTLPSG